MLEVEKATAGRMVDRMEKKGWVVAPRPDAADRRVNRLLPDRRGRAACTGAIWRRSPMRTVDDALALLSPRERDRFCRIDAAGEDGNCRRCSTRRMAP